MSKNLFEIASREAYRYPSVRGDLTTEQLWSLPLVSKNNFDLDNVAKEVNTLLKGEAEEASFVVKTNNANKTKFENMLEIVKYVIECRMKENEDRQARAKRREERDRILEILSQKEEDSLRDLSVEELRKRVAELS